jgi:hypothetical protein
MLKRRSFALTFLIPLLGPNKDERRCFQWKKVEFDNEPVSLIKIPRRTTSCRESLIVAVRGANDIGGSITFPSGHDSHLSPDTMLKCGIHDASNLLRNVAVFTLQLTTF